MRSGQKFRDTTPPPDIRHITFACGNFGIAVAGLQIHVSTELWFNTIIGITAIGVMNVLVSLGISIALRLNPAMQSLAN